MAGRYTLKLDIPFTRLDEFGWGSNRLMRDLRAGRDLHIGDGCMFEPKTGTLMLEMKNTRPDLWYAASTDSLRLTASMLDVAPNYWEETPATLALAALGGTHKWLRSGNFTLIDTLTVVSIALIASAIIASGRELVPIIASKSSYAANQGYHIQMVTHGAPGVFAKDYFAVRFGDFMISFHTDGGAELFWSSDGSCDENHWVLKKTFGHFLDPKGMTSSLASFGPSAALNFYIVPFGRGHIWFMVRSGGKIFSEIYTHKEAALNAGTGLWEITKAGKVAIYADKNGSHAMHVQLAKVGYVTSGTYDDVTFNMPYAPTSSPTLSSWWSKTSGSPTLTASLLTGAGAAWASNGTNQSYKARLALAGDGTCTPYVDAYAVSFPEVVTTVTPEMITIPHEKILKVGIKDSFRDFDGQQLEVSVLDDGSDTTISGAMWRGRITGKLEIDGESYMEVMFEKPRTILGAHFNVIQFTGVNLGAWRLTKKKFFFPSSYGGLTHPDGMRKLLKHCGFPDNRIVTDTDTLELPPADLGTEGTDTKESEIKTQPEFNSPVREFALYLRDDFSDRWKLRYEGDGKWYYQASPDPTTSQGTIQADEDTARLISGAMWYSRAGLEIQTEPPEGNVLWVIGEKEGGDAFGNKALNPGSVSSNATPKPLSYLGELDPIVKVDRTISDETTLDACLEHIAKEAFRAYAWITWKGPFNKLLKVGTRWTLFGIGDVIIEDLEGDGDTPVKFESTESTTYHGRLCIE